MAKTCLGRQHLEVGSIETALPCVALRDPSNISSPPFRAFPSQVQPVILMGTGRSVPLPIKTSLPPQEAIYKGI